MNQLQIIEMRRFASAMGSLASPGCFSLNKTIITNNLHISVLYISGWKLIVLLNKKQPDEVSKLMALAKRYISTIWSRFIEFFLHKDSTLNDRNKHSYLDNERRF